MNYTTIRELLPVEGLRVVLVTQHDEFEYLIDGLAYVCLHFENGMTVTVFINESDRLLVSCP